MKHYTIRPVEFSVSVHTDVGIEYEETHTDLGDAHRAAMRLVRAWRRRLPRGYDPCEWFVETLPLRRTCYNGEIVTECTGNSYIYDFGM